MTGIVEGNCDITAQEAATHGNFLALALVKIRAELKVSGLGQDRRYSSLCDSGNADDLILRTSAGERQGGTIGACRGW